MAEIKKSQKYEISRRIDSEAFNPNITITMEFEPHRREIDEPDIFIRQQRGADVYIPGEVLADIIDIIATERYGKVWNK